MIRVAITGFGSINALGCGAEAFADGLRAGRCGIGALTLFPADGFRTSRAAEVKELRVPASLPRAIARRASRTAVLALIAAWEAWDMAAVAAGGEQAGVVIGTTTGGMASGEEGYRRLLQSRGEEQGAPARRPAPLADW